MNYNLTPEVAVAYGHRLPNNSQYLILRLAKPLLYAAMGFSIGTVTGVAVAVATIPASASVTVNDSTQASATGSELAVSPSVSSDLRENSQPAAVVRVAANTAQPAADAGHSATDRANSGASPANPAVKVDRSPTVQTAPDEKPAVEKSPTHRPAPTETHPARPLAHPFARQGRPELASAVEVAPVPMNGEGLSLDEDVKPSNTYIEGDLTVADYDAKAGTIETSDGRTFVIGSTVSVSGATTWDDYRSDVHYRCGQDGTCTLTRAGVVALNARLV